MKKLIKLVIINIAFMGVVFAESSTKESSVAVEAVKKVSTSDQFLSFVLSKAEKYSEKGEEAIGKAVDLVMEESKPLAREFIVWRAWKHGMSFVIPLSFAFIAGVSLTYCLYRSKADGFTSDMHITFTVISGFCTFFGGLFTMMNVNELFNFIQVIVAPRVYIIEQAINLIK